MFDIIRMDIFVGPRVRMGMHYAKEDEFKTELHDMTQHLVFFGPGWDLARAIGDMAHGGQILLTAACVEGLLRTMHEAGT